ncbi:MAG: hypothetical protein AB8H79_02460 [Myxococcota bacterium]
MSDLRSLPDGILKAYLYALGAWGLAAAAAYPLDRLGLALTLCYPLALWFAGLTGWWVVRVFRQHRAGELESAEVSAGVRSIGRILAGAGMIPAIVFLARDPLAVSSWGTLVSVGALTGIGWFIANVGPRLQASVARLGILVTCWLILPINATGTLSYAWFIGWFDRVVEPVVGS